jgi:hypothetical protein
MKILIDVLVTLAAFFGMLGWYYLVEYLFAMI